MHHSTPFIYLHFLFFSALALPTTDTLPTNIIHRRCGTVGQFYNPTPADWQKYNVDVWLSSWIITHQSDISKNTAGFAGAFGQWTLGNPDWSCRDEGSTSNCDTDTVCDNRVLNDKGKDIRPAYYVLEGVSHLHTYFMNLGASLEVSAIAAALSKDSWALTFYNDKDVQSTTALKEILNAVGTIIGIGAAFAGLSGPIEGAVAGAGAALYGGAVGAATPLIGQHADDTFQKSADLGLILGSIVVGSLKAISLTNNKLMHGDQYQGNDIKDYLRKGAFVKNVAKEKSLVIDMMSNFMVANAINLLWRQQKVFIMGGGACGDKQGIGEGPQSYSVCRDGKAWYLYYWKENGGGVDLTSHQWGRVEHPPGADQLGQGDWSGVKVSDVINSSLDSYNVAGYSYDSNTAATRAKSALTDGWRNPGDQGPSWEGTFTIPVCDVGSAISSSYFDKAYILQDYGMESRPVWCGPVCNGDLLKTKQFINAANMQGFKSPKHLCPQDPGY